MSSGIQRKGGGIMNYPDYYLKACQVLECEPDDSIDAKRAAFHSMLEQWQQEYQGYEHDPGGLPELSKLKLEELKLAMAAIYEFEGSLEPQPQPSNWQDRFWLNLPVGKLIPEFSLSEEYAPWAAPVISNGWTTSPVAHRGIVFFGSTDRHAYAVDARSGEEIWRFRASAQIHFPPAVSDESVYFAIGHRQIHCLHFATGRKKWNSQTESKVIQKPLLYHDSVLLFDDQHCLYCFHADTGALQWTITSHHLRARDCVQLKAIVVMGLPLLVPLRLPHDSGNEGNGWSISDWDLTAFDPVTGEKTDTWSDWRGPSSLVAFQAMTGRVVWMLPMPGRAENLLSSVGIVYGICERSGRDDIFAIDGETGQLLWRIPLEPQEVSGKFFAGGGKTYYIDQTGNVYEIMAG
jgi:outer membrane protein assembly factor BamB